MREHCIVSKLIYCIQDLAGYLVLYKTTTETSGPHQNQKVLEIWSMLKSCWNLVLSKMSMKCFQTISMVLDVCFCQKCLWVKMTHDIYLYFWLIKMFYWSNKCVVAVQSIITLFNKSWTKCLNGCFRWHQICPNIKDLWGRTKCFRGCFGQDQMFTKSDKILHGFDPYPLERHNLHHTSWYQYIL